MGTHSAHCEFFGLFFVFGSGSRRVVGENVVTVKRDVGYLKAEREGVSQLQPC